MLAVLIQGAALLDSNETLHTQRLAGLGDGGDPLALLAQGRLLGADDLAALGLHQGGLLQAVAQ